MPFDTPQYLPISHLLFFFFAGILLGMAGLAAIGTLRHASRSLGLRNRQIFALLLASLLGSYINIPLAQLAAEQVVSGRVVDFYGMQYVVPMVVNWPGTVVAINVGGAIIPILLSLFLLARHRLFGAGVVAVALVALVCHLVAYPVHGVGIAVPFFVPPLAATVISLLLVRRRAAPLAYAAGSLGTLIGADLLNLDGVQGLGAPVVSIGGAGTFDGVFLAGLLAVLLASFLTVPDDARGSRE